MSSWGKTAMAWLGFKPKKQKTKAPVTYRQPVQKKDEEAIAGAMMTEEEEMRRRQGKSKTDFTGILGGGSKFV